MATPDTKHLLRTTLGLAAPGIVVLERYLSIDGIEGRGSTFSVTLRRAEMPDVADDTPHVASTG
jgi:hypothetical protein